MQTIKSHFTEAHQILQSFLDNDDNFINIAKAGDVILEAIKTSNKIISCGNGGSMCDAMHFAEELSGRYKHDRKALPAISISDASHITCVANDYGFDQIFSRFLEALGQPGDVLFAISTSGNSQNILNAIAVAQQKNMKIIALTGKTGGKIASLCDIEIRAPYSEFSDRAQEIHIKVIHSIIDYIEKKMLLNDDDTL
ncbi:MAG: D-sedoheptulose 7-phosphate isomerase [Sphingobacteriales bacterium]|nr:MAG: D-sedoheptulose 7-phosphate isomerase [Sphingobacteriales bacterium]